MKICFIIRGNIRKIEQLKKAIAKKFVSFDYDCFYTKFQDHAMQLAGEYASQCQIMVAVGGDGTVNEVINGLMKVEKNLRPKLAILPRGTGNDFARNLKISSSIAELYQTILNDKFNVCDIGRATFSNGSSQEKTRFFNNIIDVGIGGVVVEKINQKANSFLPANFKYLKSIFLSLLTTKPEFISVTSKDWNWKGKAYALCIANGRYFGSGMCIAPHAEINDGLFAVTLLGNVTVIDYLRNLNKVKQGKFLQHSEISYHTLDNCEIESKKPLPIDLDGEFVGFTPLKIELCRSAINVLCGSV